VLGWFAARLPEEEPAGVGAHIAVAEARTAAEVAEVEVEARIAAAAARLSAEHIAEPNTAAAGARTAVAVAGLVGAEAARLARPVSGLRIPQEVVATAPSANQARPALAEGPRPQKPPPPSPVRRKKGSLFSREGRRVRTADISS
jgi:hypothetical protein